MVVINWIPNFQTVMLQLVQTSILMKITGGLLILMHLLVQVDIVRQTVVQTWKSEHSWHLHFFTIYDFFDLNNGIGVGFYNLEPFPGIVAIFKTFDGGNYLANCLLNDDYRFFYCCEFIDPLIGWCA